MQKIVPKLGPPRENYQKPMQRLMLLINVRLQGFTAALQLLRIEINVLHLHPQLQLKAGRALLPHQTQCLPKMTP